jgi:hypothetical protein
MTTEASRPAENPIAPEVTSRPFALSLLSLAGLVFYGLIALIFLATCFYSGWISETILQYMPESAATHPVVLIIALTAFLFHAMAFYGILLIRKMRRRGYYIFGIPTLVIAASHLLTQRLSLLSLGVYIAFLFAFGAFLKKMQ